MTDQEAFNRFLDRLEKTLVADIRDLHEKVDELNEKLDKKLEKDGYKLVKDKEKHYLDV